MGGHYIQGATGPRNRNCLRLGVLLCAIHSVVGAAEPLRPSILSKNLSRRFYGTGRVLFGLLWAFDAFWKWHPYFLHRADSYLVQSQQGQPAWIVSYIQFFIDIIHIVGPFVFGLFATSIESVIALSLLFKKGLDFILPIGFVYSLGLWTTAEGWGGPYAPGFTGNRGDIWGTAIIYCYIFLYLMVMYSPFGLWKTGADR